MGQFVRGILWHSDRMMRQLPEHMVGRIYAGIFCIWCGGLLVSGILSFGQLTGSSGQFRSSDLQPEAYAEQSIPWTDQQRLQQRLRQVPSAQQLLVPMPQRPAYANDLQDNDQRAKKWEYEDDYPLAQDLYLESKQDAPAMGDSSDGGLTNPLDR